MKKRLTDLLCTECGLCCDGSLFADVELAGEKESSGLEVLGLEVEDAEDDHGLLIQPCGALKGKRCSIYAHRPGCCRTFECRLLQQVRRGEIPIHRAKETISKTLSQVKAIKGLLGRLRGKQDDKRLPLKERVALALSEESPTGPGQIRRRMESEMSSVERVIHGTFLGL